MARLRDVAAVCLAIGSVCALYGLKYDTRKLEARAQRLERAAERGRSDIAVLKVERAYLGRPERIEGLARAQGLGQVREEQYLRLGEAFEDGIARLIDKAEPDRDEPPER